MNLEDNLPPGADTDINAPYNDDTIDCKKCRGFGVILGGLLPCDWCDGEGELSQREYDRLYAEEMENREL